MELGDRRTSLPDELSRGMRQKLALGCAFVHDPKVLLLDEPLTGLDPVGIRRMKDAIRRKASEGTAVLLSSHLLGVVSELCSRVIVLGHGKALAEGSPAEIAARGPALGGSLEDAVLDLLTRMTGAVGYLLSRSAWNRTRRIASEFRKPGPRIAAVAAIGYFGFLAWLSPRGGGGTHDTQIAAVVGALGLLVLVLSAWLLGTGGKLVELSSAERALLLPAPISGGAGDGREADAAAGDGAGERGDVDRAHERRAALGHDRAGGWWRSGW